MHINAHRQVLLQQLANSCSHAPISFPLYLYLQTIHGLKTYHYGPSASVFAGPDENPDNVAFCYPDGKEESCLGKGLLRVSECKKVRAFMPIVTVNTILKTNGYAGQRAARILTKAKHFFF